MGLHCTISFEISNFRVFKNKSKRTRSSSLALRKLRCCLHSWRWFEIWMVGDCFKWFSNSIPKSWWMGNWKYVRNVVARALKFPCEAGGFSTYNFVDTPLRVRWNSLNQIMLSMILFDEHHRWKVTIWLLRSFACLPSNFGISKRSFVGMGGQLGSCTMGSFISLAKSGRFNEAKKGDWEFDAIAICEDTKFWLEWGLVYGVPCCEFSWLPEWDALLFPPGVKGGVVCGVVLGDQLGFPTMVSPIKEEPMMVAVFHLWRLNDERPGTPLGNGGRSKRRLDQWGSIRTVRVSTRLGFRKLWEDRVYDQRKIMATYIKQSENKKKFPFKLIYVIT